MHEINIDGEIIPFELYDMTGYINLPRVESQLNNAKGQPIKVNINSVGGDVDEGFLIYAAIRKYAKENNVRVTTYAKGRCFSIATVVFLAGDDRIGNKFIEPFIHNAWTYAIGDSKEMSRVASDLEKVNNKIASHYSEHTNLTIDEALELMNNDTFIDNDFALNIRFATEIEEIVRPAALKKILNKNKIEMANNDDKKFLDKLKKIFASDAKNAVELFTATNETLFFPDLEEGTTPKVGDRATIDGKNAEGEYTLPDGTVYVFVNGVLDEIRKKEEEEDGDTEERIEELESENARLRQEIESQNKKLDKVIKAQKDQEKYWNSLKDLVSSEVVDDKGNDPKSDNNKEESKGLAGAANRLKERNKK